jgi:hypothetical protein
MVDRDRFEHEIRNAVAGVELETRRIRQAMERMEKHLYRMDQACKECLKEKEYETDSRADKT